MVTTGRLPTSAPVVQRVVARIALLVPCLGRAAENGVVAVGKWPDRATCK